MNLAPDTDHRGLGFVGLSPAILALDVRRMLRNRRTAIFSLVMPVIFFLIFGTNSAFAKIKVGTGNVSADVMISMALYGAVLSTASAGAMVSIERAAGWSRQLRITPLSPFAYIAAKMLVALLLGAVSVASVYAAGAIVGDPSLPVQDWVLTAIFAWAGSVLFAAFGLFAGYLLPSENVMQIMGFALMLFAFGGGLFIPLSQYSPTLRTIAEFTPLYGLSQIVHYPLFGKGFDWVWVLNLLVWLAIFSAGATWRFRRDTARV